MYHHTTDQRDHFHGVDIHHLLTLWLYLYLYLWLLFNIHHTYLMVIPCGKLLLPFDKPLER